MKKFLSVMLTLCMILPLFAALPISAATPTEGYAFGGKSGDDASWFYADGKLADAPRTIEAWIYVDPAHAKETRTIISNYNGFASVSYWHLATKCEGSNLFPYFEWNELSNNTTSTRKFNFRNVPIKAGEWTHLTIVVDAENKCCHAYKNGALGETKGASIWLGDIRKTVTDLPLVIGNDARFNNPDSRVFGGSIASISLFSDKRTADEIKSDYKNGADYNDINALAHWELSAEGKNVEDKTAHGIDLLFSKQWLTETEMENLRGDSFDPAYSFAVVGDIQYITEYDAKNGTSHVSNMHKWIADNVANKNIQYVMGMGDVTNRNIAEEWEVALAAITQLNGKVPYSVINGNHDLYTGTTSSADAIPGKTQLGPTAIDSYFGQNDAYVSQFTGANGGLYESNSVRNTYYKLTVGETKWLFVNLDFGASDEVLAWANKIVAANPDHKVVVTTHGYLHMDGTPISNEDSGSLWGDTINNGEEMWTKFVSLHENIVMVLSGHMESNIIMMNQAKGVHGNTVTQFLIDQQAVDKPYMSSSEAMPLGLVAMFYFDKDGKNVSVEWYSPLRDKYYQTRNHLSFDMTAESEEPVFTWDGTSKKPAGSGTATDPYIVESPANLLWISTQIEEAKLYEGGTVSLENTYFKQVCDIDLEGGIIKSIGHYHTSESGLEKVNAFGGHYDGGGFSIKNGTVIDAWTDHGVNINWSTALFGCIWGATIENVTLDSVTIWSRGVTGGIVGRAVAPRNTTVPSDFNVISNCHVKDTCKFVTMWAYGKSISSTEYGYNTRYRAGVVAPICAIAYATTIKGCTSAIEFAVDGEHSMAGGIAGMAGYNSVIESCSFTGGISLTDNNTTVAPTFGGIVALLAPNYETQTMNPEDDYRGTLTIRNCVNSGYFLYTGGEALPNGIEMHWGGILGHAKMLEKFTGKQYLIENCYNLYEKEIEAVMKDNENYWLGGIIGKADAGQYDLYDSVVVKNCASVEIEAVGGMETKSTNEYRTTGIPSLYGALPVIPENVTTSTAEALRLEALIAQNAQSSTKWYTGSGAPTIEANVGDLYLDIAAGDVYKMELEWKLLGNIKGPQGETGAQGPQGETGAQGPQGETGAQGPQGETGAQGPQGETGAQGPQGETGAQGPQGETGAQGPQGETGAQGPQGETGAQGPAGADGANGLTPFIGENGNWWIGETDTGIKAVGTDGKDGADGTNGADGADGANGLTPFIGENGNWWIGENDTGIKAIGVDGKDGKDGVDGKDGKDGINGKDGVDGEDGKDGVDGEDGKDGVDGKDGANGTNGKDGVDGEDGKDGVDGETPFIGENGNWWIGDTDTGVKAAAEDGGCGSVVGSSLLITAIALALPAAFLLKKKENR